MVEQNVGKGPGVGEVVGGGVKGSVVLPVGLVGKGNGAFERAQGGGTPRSGGGKVAVGGGLGTGQGKGAWEVGKQRRGNEEGGGGVELRAPSARPKAKAAPLASGATHTGGAKQAWPGLEKPYMPPEKSRIELAGQLEALEQRAQELDAGDPRLVQAKERIQEVERALKDAGGRTPSKLYFSLLDGQKELGKRGKAIEVAREVLERAKAASARVLEEEANAEAWLRACIASEENCRARNAHLAFQAAIEATVGLDGYNELEQKLHYIGSCLAAKGMVHAEEAFMSVAWFVQKFAPQSYSKADDPILQELASSGSDATVLVGDDDEGVDWMALEAAGEHKAIRKEVLLPKAFETPIATKEAARLAKPVGAQCALPAVLQNGKTLGGGGS